jgi:RNA polymerase sigma factor (sigma-70 family)
MASSAAPVTTAEVAALHDRITRFVFANFHRKLSFEEARDAAADALGEADRAVTGGQAIRDLDAWLCTAAWRNAISMVRKVEGEGRRKRLRPVDVSEQGEWLLDDRDVEGEILTRHGRRTEHETLARAWSRLKRDEQRALYLRYFDELPVDEVLAILGCSRHHYENLTKRGLRKLRDALVARGLDDACRGCRTAIIDSQLSRLEDERVAQRDAHLSSCLSCRAFDRRQRGLIALLPLPPLGFVDRLTARLHGFASSGADATHPGEAAAGAVALAGAGAGAGAVGAGSAAGGLLSVGGGVKAVALLCGAGAMTAGVCATTLPSRNKPPAAPRAAAAQKRPPAKARIVEASPPPVVAVQPRSSTTVASTTPSRKSARVAAARRARVARVEAARRASSPFLPESAAPPERTTASAGAAARTRSFSGASVPAASPSSSPKATPASTAFAQEFTP